MDAETPVFLAPRRRRRGIPGRIASDGSVVTPLDENAVREVVRGEDGNQPIAPARLLKVQSGDPGVGEIAAHENGVEKTWGAVVIQITAGAGNQPRILAPANPRADLL